MDAARRRLFDTALVAAIGLRLPEADGLRAARPAAIGVETIPLLAGATRATEVDDIATAGCVTAGSVVIPVVLAVGAARGADDRALLSAIVAGYDAMLRFAAAIDGPALLYRGYWPTYLAAPIGAAAVSARLSGLDAEATGAALALAIARTAWLIPKGASRWHLLGMAAMEGVAVAGMAGAGVTADAEVLGRWAKAALVAVDPAILAQSAPAIHDIDTKSFPTSRQGLSAIVAFAEAFAGHAPGKAIEAVRIGVPEAYRAMVGSLAMPGDRIASMLSIAYQAALVSCHPDRLYDVARSDRPASPAIEALLARFTVVGDPELDRLYPARWAGRATILWQDGTRNVSTVTDPPGSARDPFDWDRLAGKGSDLARANGLDQTRVERLLALAQGAGVVPEARSAAGILKVIQSR